MALNYRRRTAALSSEPDLVPSSSVATPNRTRPPRVPTVPGHAHGQALLQSAVLAAVAAGAVDQAVLLPGTGVRCVTLLAPPEEALGEERCTHA